MPHIWQRNPFALVAVSLAGASFVAVTQILTRDKLSTPLYCAVTIFAVAIPLLIKIAIEPPVVSGSHQIVHDDDPEIAVMEGFLFVVGLDVVAFGFVFSHDS